MKYSNKTIALYDALKAAGIVGATGNVKLTLLNLEVTIKDKSATGNLIQEWLGNWMESKNIFHRTKDNTQEFPDFYLSESDTNHLLEVKTFDYTKNPNFDVAQFDAYVRSVVFEPYKLDADYLIFGYTLEDGVLTIKDIWLKKIWEITCPSGVFPIKVQQKQNKIHNIRPYNFKANSERGAQPFTSRLQFVEAIKSTLQQYDDATIADPDIWFNEVKDAYNRFTGEQL